MNRVSIVKPSKARAVEELLLRMAQTGQIREKVGESQLIELLENIAASQQAETNIKVLIVSLNIVHLTLADSTPKNRF